MRERDYWTKREEEEEEEKGSPAMESWCYVLIPPLEPINYAYTRPLTPSKGIFAPDSIFHFDTGATFSE